MDLGGGSAALAAGLGGDIDLLSGGLDIITGHPTAPAVQVSPFIRTLLQSDMLAFESRSSIRLLFLNLDPLHNSAIVTSYCVQ